MSNSNNKMPEQYSLKWNNFHANLTTGFHGLFEDEDLVDVSLAVEGKIIQAHKVILSVCSPYFKSLFRIHPEKHPIVFLKDVGYSEVIGLLQFMYQGQVDVSQDQLTEFLRVAEMLQIKGLTSHSSDNVSSKKTNNTSATTNHLADSNLLEDDDDPLIPVPVLSTPSIITTKTVNSSISLNNMLKRKKSPNSHENGEPALKIVNVDTLRHHSTTNDDDNDVTAINGGDDPLEDSSNVLAVISPLPSKKTSMPKLEPVEDYNESSFTDYSEVGENFMTHFIMDDTSDSPIRSQISSFGGNFYNDQRKTSSPPGSSNNDQNQTNKLTTQQIMNIDVSLLQDPNFKTKLACCEVAQVVSRKLYYRGYYYRREKLTYNQKLMWKCVSYSRTKCLSRVHTYDGRIIFASDKHNHPPPLLDSEMGNQQTHGNSMESNQQIAKTLQNTQQIGNQLMRNEKNKSPLGFHSQITPSYQQTTPAPTGNQQQMMDSQTVTDYQKKYMEMFHQQYNNASPLAIMNAIQAYSNNRRRAASAVSNLNKIHDEKQKTKALCYNLVQTVSNDENKQVNNVQEVNKSVNREDIKEDNCKTNSTLVNHELLTCTPEIIC